MHLYGSTTSPYVRRIRLYLAALAKNNVNSDHQFMTMDIFSAQDRKQLIADNPTLKVPYLIDNNEHIFDSRVIFRYLSEKFEQPKLSWREENLLTLIDAVNDSLVSLFLCKRSGLDNQQDLLFFNLQHQRVQTTLAVLNKAVTENEFKQWTYPAICLFCLLDWLTFRELYPLEELSALKAFLQQHQQQVFVKETDPRV